MAFLCRINQSKLTHFSNQFKRHYFHICYASSIDSGRTTKHVSEYIARIIPRGPADFGGKVRFYAAPVQVLILVLMDGNGALVLEFGMNYIETCVVVFFKGFKSCFRC